MYLYLSMTIIPLFGAGKGMWASMVSLAQAVQRAVVETSGGTPEALEASHDLELVLQRHRNTFISLLRNPPKSASERWCSFVE